MAGKGQHAFAGGVFSKRVGGGDFIMNGNPLEFSRAAGFVVVVDLPIHILSFLLILQFTYVMQSGIEEDFQVDIFRFCHGILFCLFTFLRQIFCFCFYTSASA